MARHVIDKRTLSQGGRVRHFLRLAGQERAFCTGPKRPAPTAVWWHSCGLRAATPFEQAAGAGQDPAPS
jgi:hypothetical protein